MTVELAKTLVKTFSRMYAKHAVKATYCFRFDENLP